MASIVKIKRSAVQGKAPTTSTLETGEIAINTRDGKIFSSDGSRIIELGANSSSASFGTATFGNTNITTFDSSSNWYYAGHLNLSTNKELVFDNYSYSNQTKINHEDSALNITQTNSNAKVKITGGAGLDLEGQANVASLSINGEFSLPTTDGNANQFLQTDGSGNLSWVDTDTESTFNSYIFTTSNNQTIFSGTDDFNRTLSHNTNNVGGVYLNGVLLRANTDYTFATNNQITLTEGSGDADLLTIHTFSSTTNFVNVNVDISSNTETTTTTNETVVDSFGTGDYRSAKYVVQMTNNANSTYQTSEVMVLHDGSSTYLTEYGRVSSLNNLGSIDSDISSGSVRLKVTPINADTTIKVVRTSITV